MGKTGRRTSPGAINKMRRRYEEGASLSQIAREMGSTFGTVKKYVMENEPQVISTNNQEPLSLASGLAAPVSPDNLRGGNLRVGEISKRLVTLRDYAGEQYYNMVVDQLLKQIADEIYTVMNKQTGHSN